MINRVLVVSPHTDDGELGCGGAIARFLEEKKEVFYVALSTCEESVPKGFDKDVLKKEVKLATKKLGIPAKNIFVKNYPVRQLVKYRQEVLEDLIILRKQIEPDLVLTPAINDTHQDHAVASQETLRAFRYTSILGYEIPWNNNNFPATFFVHLSKLHVTKKLRALRCYKSQKHRLYMQDDFMLSLARVRGTQANMPYAEAFDLIKWHLTLD